MNVDKVLCDVVDRYFACRPQKKPIIKNKPQIVSHRGEHDNSSVYENTLAAFDAARDLGAWGIEFDVRWTLDMCPVVIHDLDCWRVFGQDVIVADVTLAELKKQIPAIPTLAEVIQRYGKDLHLMVELKSEPYQNSQSSILKGLFIKLEPCKDFHILTLNPDMFDYVNFLPPKTFLLVAEKNVTILSHIATERGYGGITGHYLLLNQAIHRVHRDHGQSIGTGFIASRNCLYREIGRGVEWLFTNSMKNIRCLNDISSENR